jgi:hypothetical protein
LVRVKLEVAVLVLGSTAGMLPPDVHIAFEQGTMVDDPAFQNQPETLAA